MPFLGTGTSYIEPGSPWENPFVESFGSRMRDEVLSTEQFNTLFEAQVLIGGLEARVQQLQAPQQSWVAFAGRVRYGLQVGEPTGGAPPVSWTPNLLGMMPPGRSSRAKVTSALPR